MLTLCSHLAIEWSACLHLYSPPSLSCSLMYWLDLLKMKEKGLVYIPPQVLFSVSISTWLSLEIMRSSAAGIREVETTEKKTEQWAEEAKKRERERERKRTGVRPHDLRKDLNTKLAVTGLLTFGGREWIGPGRAREGNNTNWYTESYSSSIAFWSLPLAIGSPSRAILFGPHHEEGGWEKEREREKLKKLSPYTRKNTTHQLTQHIQHELSLTLAHKTLIHLLTCLLTSQKNKGPKKKKSLRSLRPCVCCINCSWAKWQGCRLCERCTPESDFLSCFLALFA